MTPPTDNPDDPETDVDPGGDETDGGTSTPSHSSDDATSEGGESYPQSGDEAGRLWSIDPDSEQTAVQQLVGETATATAAAETGGTDMGELFVDSTDVSPLGETTGPDPDRTTARERRRTHGFIRAYFLGRTQRYYEFQRTLNRGRTGTSYDRYLTRLVYVTAAVAVFAAVLGGVAGWTLSGPSTGLFAGIAGGIVAGIGTWYAGTYYPTYRVGRRKRAINLVFPDAIVFMYALSESGMNLAEIVERLAAAEDAYGEVAREFEVAHRDMQLYGNDLYTSMRNMRNLTPSENLEQFVDDLLSLMEGGGELTRFLDDQSEQYFQRASEDQEDLLNQLALLGEVFIVGFVAAPLLVVVIMIIISLLGDDMLLELSLFIYAFLPLAFVGFGLLVSGLLDPYVDRRMTLSVGDESTAAIAPTGDGNPATTGDGRPSTTVAEPTGEDEEAATFRSFYRRKQLVERLLNPLSFFRTSPLRTLVLTLPLAALYLAVTIWQGLVPTTVAGWQDAPVTATNLGVIVPLVGMMAPIALLHEIDSQRRRSVVDRFPNTLYVLSSANTMGISLVDGLGVVARTAQGYYARQLRILQNDIRWNNDPSSAMLRFANRIDVPVVSRTLKLLAEGRRSTTDLSRVLRIAAEDTRNRFRLVRRRQQEMQSYVVVVIVGYLIFLGVIVVLDQSYLSVVAEILESADEEEAAEGLISDVPVDTYRLLFFHAVIVQALGAGLLSGLLTDNRAKSGLKYTVVLLLLAALAFTLVQ